uniref:AlNc14C143G7326 protein n=1 Tax=Albugo laibachii Nc14 TaxID=890382 RepID=F0WLD8_9STRA|nr:AlNc14C143G7326 [Albugo laibachii Nc14]|eukprot:CCA22101.1 AlNc14C143G7326 [Albugo laibachii Nc14]
MFTLFRNVLTTILGQEWLFALSEQRKSIPSDVDDTSFIFSYWWPEYQQWQEKAAVVEEKHETLNWKDVRARKAPELVKASVDYSSNASTCEYSDEEENCHPDKSLGADVKTPSIVDSSKVEEDIGEREMKLMNERARQIKRLGVKSKSKRGSRKAFSKSQYQGPSATRQEGDSDRQIVELVGPLCLVNTTNALWNWSVQSGFETDLFPPSIDFAMTSICMEKLENEALFDALIDQVLLA